MIVNGNNIEAQRTLFHMALCEESLRGANHDSLLFAAHTEFWQRGRVFFYRTRSHFHKRQRLAVVADQIQFASYSAWHVVFATNT